MAAAVRQPDLEELARVASRVPDPEIPSLGLGDLGIVRSVEFDPDRPDTVVVTVTPTYSGCPATEVIQADLIAALESAGAANVRVERVLNPPWTSDWITQAGRAKLTAAGIAPPLRPPSAPGGTAPVPVHLGRRAGQHQPPRPPCPRCGSTETRLVSAFGSTACKAQHRCTTCAEPFDYFKAT